MATGDLVVGSDGELVLKVGPWAKGKLFHIRRYCHIFNMGMRNKWPVRAYIDLFAGPGKCLIEETKEEIDGSPLVALSCKVPFTHYFFNDVQSGAIKSLQARAEAFDYATINYFSRDCNEIIDELVKKLPSGSLDFCFIDPFNWQINFDSIRRLTARRQMDLAVTFHAGNMKRVADKPPKELLDFFPDFSWQQEYKEASRLHRSIVRVLLDAYERGLRNLGYDEIKDYVLERNKKNVPLYYLIFASKNPKGAEFWDKIAVHSETGQLRMPV
ncbi:MAG: three-Cys-motif partner protein TcmP [Chloroflexi bacterium]|nr:three-Cys-motif partner protein TcmP [Chloroflexota bacterium]